MSYNTMLYALYRMGYHGRATVHGFRALASTALNEMGFRPDVIERQLAHEEGNAVRAAYNRAEYLNERRAMMKHWADFIELYTGYQSCGFNAARNVAYVEENQRIKPVHRCSFVKRADTGTARTPRCGAHLDASPASAFRTSDWDKPNCRAIRDGLTPTLKAARTAFILPGVK